MHIVGIGASAGGLEALEHFFHHMPQDTGAAFVVVQHLSPDFKSLMKELLAPHVEMPVVHIEDGMQPRPNTIYLLSAGQMVQIEQGRLRLLERAPQQGLNLPIDLFFSSLARDWGAKSVAVVLSGTGSDGTRGVVAVHEAGGLVMVQSRSSAQFDGMPQSAIATGVVDCIAAPWEMPSLLERSLHPERQAPEEESLEEEEILKGLVRLMDRRYGLDFSRYKLPGVRRRLRRRMELCQVPDLESLMLLLEKDQEVADSLYRDLLIDVTTFFRDAEMFEALEGLLPSLFASHPPERPIRVWATACANGSEAYSLAILLYECAERLGWPLDQIKVFATDVHRGAMEEASLGQFSAREVQGLSAERLGRFFILEDGVYTARPWLRHMMIFAHHNLLRDPPFTRMDLVSCRNMLIYLQPEAQLQVLSSLTFALRRQGLLVLGKSEHLGALETQYDPVSKRTRIYSLKEEGVRPVRLSQPIVPLLSRPRAIPTRTAFEPDIHIQRAYDALLQQYVPPSLLVDSSFHLVHIFGDAGRYLRNTPGRVSHEVVLRMVDGLSIPAATALQRVTREKAEVSFTSLRVFSGTEQEQMVVLKAKPITGAGGSLFFLLTIEPQALDVDTGLEEALVDATETLRENLDVDSAARLKLEELHYELRHTREHLQATVEELGASNEELQATNEEMVISNEELQSTNEELHSVNEELYTVNAEYQRKIEELTELNADLNNLLRSSQVGIIFLDREMKVRKFTDSATRCFHLLPQDVGRSLEHLAPLVEVDALSQGLERVLTGQEPEVRQEVRHKAGDTTYVLRILPYLNDAVEVEGAVLIFNDVTTLKETEENLKRAHAELTTQARTNRAVLRSLLDRVFFYDRNKRLTYLNPSALASLGLERKEQALGRTLEELELPRDILESFDLSLERVFKEKVSEQILLSSFERTRRPGGFSDYSLSPVLGSDGEVELVVAVSRNVTQEQELRWQQAQSEQELRDFLEELPLAAAYVSAKRKHHFCNRAYQALTSYKEGDDLQKLLGEGIMRAARPAILDALAGEGSSFEATGALVGQECTVRGHCLPYSQGFREGSFLLVLEDLTQERRALELERLRQAQSQRAQKMESLGMLAGGIAHDFNNMLSIILGNTSLLQSLAGEMSEAERPLKDIQSTTLRAAELCRQMLTYSGQAELHCVSTDLNELVKGLVELMGVSLPKGISFRLELAPRLPLVWADKTQVDQVLLNLVTNASQAMQGRPGGVTVSTGTATLSPSFCERYRVQLEPGDYVRLSVTDDGVGIAQELLERIFEPFFSLREKGHGLGLAMVFSIVHNHQGAIEVESQLGLGTTFHIYLPLAPFQPAPSQGSTPRASGEQASSAFSPCEEEGRGLLLCADDEPALLRLEQMVLQRAGFEVITALNGQELLERFHEHQDRLAGVLMDVTMPVLDGVHCMREIRAREPSLPIVLTSGYMDADLLEALQLDEACLFLQKPWGPEALLQALLTVLPGR